MNKSARTTSQWSVVLADVIPSPSWNPEHLPDRMTTHELGAQLLGELDHSFPLSRVLREQLTKTILIEFDDVITEQLDADALRDTSSNLLAKLAAAEAAAKLAKDVNRSLRSAGMGELQLVQGRYLETSGGEHVDVGWAFLEGQPWNVRLPGRASEDCQFYFVAGVRAVGA